MTKATDMRAHHDRVKLVIVRVQYASRRPGTRTACNTWYTPAGHAYGGPAPYASSSSLLLPFATPAGTPTCTLATATPAAARRGTPTPASARNHRWSALCTAATCHPETRPEQPGHARTGKGGHEQRRYTCTREPAAACHRWQHSPTHLVLRTGSHEADHLLCEPGQLSLRQLRHTSRSRGSPSTTGDAGHTRQQQRTMPASFSGAKCAASTSRPHDAAVLIPTTRNPGLIARWRATRSGSVA